MSRPLPPIPVITAGTGSVTTGHGSGKTVVPITTPIALPAANALLLDNETNAVIAGGNFNDRIYEQGTGATITLGNGNDEVFDTGGTATITLGNGNDRVVVGGNGNIIVVGNGNDRIEAAGSGNRITVGNGNDVVAIGVKLCQGNVIPVTADTINLGAGNAKLLLGGSGNTVNVGTGTAEIYAPGASNNVFALNAAGGTLEVHGFRLTNGDVLDLTHILAGVSLAHDLSNLGNFIALTSAPDVDNPRCIDTTLTITGSAGVAVVTLDNSGKLTLAGLEKASLLLPAH